MKKGLLILSGESFRDVNPYLNIKLRDTENGIKYQTESSISHMNLIHKFKKLNCHMDVAIHTYNTQYENELIMMYENIVYKSFNEPRNFNSASECMAWVIENVFLLININDYDFILITRFDILFKDELLLKLHPNFEKIIYPNIMSNDLCIADIFVFVPKKYYYSFNNWNGIMNNKFFICNTSSIALLIKNGLTIDDFEFVTDDFYIGNTFQSKNPLYAINSREEGPNYPLYYTGTDGRISIWENCTQNLTLPFDNNSYILLKDLITNNYVLKQK